MTPQLDLSLRSRPMLAVLLAQFLSAFGDNALLITAIGLVKSQGHLEWIPLLQVCFVLPFILLAPFVGALADAFPKGRVMLLANGLKLGAAALMAAGFNPLFCYGLAGLGAAAYSPAKYGILSQLFGPEKLVKANGLLEGSTIVAILLGVVAGGWLADQGLAWAFTGVIGVYALAAAVNLLIPRLPPEHPLARFDAAGLLREFVAGLAERHFVPGHHCLDWRNYRAAGRAHCHPAGRHQAHSRLLDALAARLHGHGGRR